MRPTIVYIIFSCFLACGCGPQDKNVTQWPYGVKYEVFVMSFADADGDGKGDFRGLTEKLDYLKELGVNGIWLMPIMPSDTYHKYHVIDFMNIDPDYGTLDDFKKFVTEAHARDIRVITDYVINHTGNNHPWFLEAQKGKDNPYRDYYVWAKRDSIRDQLFKSTRSYDSDNIQKWHAVGGDTLQDQYYGYFNGLCPDLNLDNPRVRREIVDIARFWLDEVKVDGFRMDAARHIFPDERAEDNHNFWVWFREEMVKIKPDVYLVGEVWAQAKEVAPYLKGLPSLFNFDLGYAITDVARAGRDTVHLVKKYKEIRDYYKSINENYLDATFVKNHDQTRLMTIMDGNTEKAKMAAALLLTLPGTPYLYYGEEIGMLGDKLQHYQDIFGPDAYVREPFIWDEDGKEPLQTAWEDARYSTDETVVPFSKQVHEPESLLNFYKRLIAFRNSNKALTYGHIEETDVHRSEVVSFFRTHEGGDVMVLHNVSDVEVTVALTDNAAGFNEVAFDTAGGKVALQGGEINLPAYTTVVLHKN